MIGALLIIFLAVYIYRKDKYRLGSIISPAICFILPTFLITVLYDMIGPSLGFYDLNQKLYWDILLCGFFFVIGGHLACKLRPPRLGLHEFKNDQVLLRQVEIPRKVYLFISFIVLLLFYRIYSLGGVSVLMDVELQEQYASSGVFGHFLVFAIFSVSLLLAIRHVNINNAIFLILLLAVFVSVVFYQVKSWLIFPILASIIYKMNMGFQQSYWKFGIAFIAIVICFILGYAFTVSLDDADNQLFILNHFLKYIFAGVGGWSEAINGHYFTGENPFYLLQPFSHFLGIDQAGVDSRYSYVIINDNGEYTNVFTLIGTAILFAGGFIANIYFFILGFISYILAIRCIRTHSVGLMLAYSILCTALCLGFFGSYFTLLNVYELMFYGVVIGYFILRYRNKLLRVKGTKTINDGCNIDFKLE